MYRRSAHSWAKHMDFMALDLLCLHIAFLAAFLTRHGLRNPYAEQAYLRVLIVMTLVNVIMAVVMNTYKSVLKRGLYKEFVATVRQVIVVVFSAMVFLFAMQEGARISRTVLFVSGLYYGVLAYLTRLGWKYYLRKRINEEAGKRSLLIITTLEKAEEVICNIKQNNFEAFRLKGVILLETGHVGEEVLGVPVVAETAGAAEYACSRWVDELLVYVPDVARFPQKIVQDFMQMGVAVHMSMPDVFNPYGQKQFMENIGGYSVLTSGIQYISDWQIFQKRVMDIVIGSIGSLIAVLLTIIFAPIIWVISPGPIFFKQVRVGKNGKKFKMYKFRSMRMDAEERKAELMKQNNIKDGMMFKMDNDPRIIGTKILPDGTVKKGFGNFLRDFSLDEFPQFFNVLMGDMSVVGTRPPTVDEWEKYELHHRTRLAIKPGITGLWQVSGRSNITNFEEVVKLDAKYIANWDLGLDLRICAKTIGIVMKREGAK